MDWEGCLLLLCMQVHATLCFVQLTKHVFMLL